VTEISTEFSLIGLNLRQRDAAQCWRVKTLKVAGIAIAG